MMKIIPIILSGGFGTRLWPLSRKQIPKQFLTNLFDHETLFSKAVKLVNNPKLFLPPITVTHTDHRLLVLKEFDSLGVTPTGIILEPCAKNTAIAIMSACVQAMVSLPDEKILFLVLPSDHLIAPPELFVESVIHATEVVQDYIVTFGVEPHFPATHYGYIKTGKPVSPHCFAVNKFQEKPDKQVASQLLAEGGYLWNGGILLFQADVFLKECAIHMPAQLNIAKHAISQAAHEGLVCSIHLHDYQPAQNISVDYAILEKSTKVATTALTADWSDVGDFNTIYSTGIKDNHGNVVQGNVELQDTSDSLIHSSKNLVACTGLKNMLVVATDDATLIADRSNPEAINLLTKKLLSQDKSAINPSSAALPAKKKVLVVVNNYFFVITGFDIFFKQFPNRIPVWKDFEFELVSTIQARKSNHYDFVIFYSDHKYYGWNYQPFMFTSELYHIKYRKVLFVGFESDTVDAGVLIPGTIPGGYKFLYKDLFNTWPYRDFEAFILQEKFQHPKTHMVDFIPYPTYLIMNDDQDKLDYDFFSNHSPKKEKLLAVVCSSENYSTHHPIRIEFSHKIKEHYGDSIDFYGRGFNPFDNKYYTLSPYKYLLVLENGIQRGYWTEKLADSYIAECYPIYFGCPNITDFFDPDSLTTIDIHDFDACVKTIDNVIANNLFEKNYDKLMIAKKQCLNDYNLFNMLRKFCLESLQNG